MYYLIDCLFLPVNFYFQLLYYLALFDSSLYILFVEILTVFILFFFFFWSFMSIFLILIYLELFIGRMLISTLFPSLSKGMSCSLVWNIFLHIAILPKSLF